MKNLYRIIAIFALVLTTAFAEAQSVSPIDFMRYNPYQMKANPASDLPYVSVMSLVVGNIDLNVQNTTLRYDNLFEFNAQGRPTTMNLRQFANSLSENNFLGVNVNWDLFNLFRRLNKGMLTIDYGIKVKGDMKYNDGLFKLLGYGNGAFVGENNPVRIDMDVNAQIYQEFAVGYQLNVTDKLSVSGRAKLLFGFADVATDACNAKLYTDPDSYALRLEENMAMHASLPKFFWVDEGKLMTNGHFKMAQLFRNPGFGVDLAAEYRFDDRFSAVAAIHDLGFIHWSFNNIEMSGKINDAGQYYDNGSFLFSGMSATQLEQVASDLTYREQYLDSLQQYFGIEFAQMGSYNASLNTNILLRGNYDYDAYNRFSAQVQGCFLGSGFRPAVTLAYCGSFFRRLDVCATYTVMPHSYDNIGLGISGRLGKTCILYFTTSNVFGVFKPLGTSGVNAQVGMVFSLLPEDKNNEYE